MWSLVFLATVAATSIPSVYSKCDVVTPNRIVERCKVFDSLVWEMQSYEAILCTASNITSCLSKGCCWHNNTCYRKPVKCYADFRLERCRRRIGWPVSQIFTGYSLNGSYCYIDVIKSYISSHADEFGYSTSVKGVRVLSRDEDPCVIRAETKAEKIAGTTGLCTVEMPPGKPINNGSIVGDKCVLSVDNNIKVIDFGLRNTCLCEVDAWLEEIDDDTGISGEIRSIVEKEEVKSTCYGILGRLLRNSWKYRVNIVSRVEVDVVVDTLLNITRGQAKVIDIDDAEIMLETSDQLSKYKFYDGLDNHSANLLIRKSTEYVSNLLGNVLTPANMTSSIRRKRSTDTQISDMHFQRVQRKMMTNLEEIAQNVASLIDLPDNSSNYIVEAKHAAVNLRVAIAKPNDLENLHGMGAQPSEHNFTWNAHVSDFHSYDGDDDVALITAYYDLPDRNTSTNAIRRSGVLAINPRTVNNGMVGEYLSFPVVFSLPISKHPWNHFESQYLCSYLEESNEETDDWKQTGCTVKSITNTLVSCQCNHTTHFAVLMTVTTYEAPEEHVSAWRWLTIIFGSVSVAALAVTLVVFISYRQILLHDRMLIHFQMVIALTAGYSFFLLGSIFSSSHLNIPTACFIFTVADHLFFLATFFWFLMEGVYLFYKVVLVFSTKWGECGAKYAPVFGWGTPLVIVGISVGISRGHNAFRSEGTDAYYNMDTCFLQVDNGMIWAFLGPVLAIVMVNLCILLKVVVVIYQSSKSSSEKSKTTKKEVVTHSIRTSTKGAIILLPILGIPWIVNMFSNVQSTFGIVASYIHVVLMGVQGVSIFMFYCIFNSDVRRAYKLSSQRKRSLASIEMANKNRKRSHIPLVASSNGSENGIRYKNSVSVSSSGRTYTLTSQLSNSSSAASPVRTDKQFNMPVLPENS